MDPEQLDRLVAVLERLAVATEAIVQEMVRAYEQPVFIQTGVVVLDKKPSGIEVPGPILPPQPRP
jgi:precorrin-6B methylase 1